MDSNHTASFFHKLVQTGGTVLKYLGLGRGNELDTSSSPNFPNVPTSRVSLLQQESISKSEEISKKYPSLGTIKVHKDFQMIDLPKHERENEHIVNNLKYEIINERKFTSTERMVAKRIVNEENYKRLAQLKGNVSAGIQSILITKYDPGRFLYQDTARKGNCVNEITLGNNNINSTIVESSSVISSFPNVTYLNTEEISSSRKRSFRDHQKGMSIDSSDIYNRECLNSPYNCPQCFRTTHENHQLKKKLRETAIDKYYNRPRKNENMPLYAVKSPLMPSSINSMNKSSKMDISQVIPEVEENFTQSKKNISTTLTFTSSHSKQISANAQNLPKENIENSTQTEDELKINIQKEDSFKKNQSIDSMQTKPKSLESKKRRASQFKIVGSHLQVFPLKKETAEMIGSASSSQGQTTSYDNLAIALNEVSIMYAPIQINKQPSPKDKPARLCKLYSNDILAVQNSINEMIVPQHEKTDKQFAIDPIPLPDTTIIPPKGTCASILTNNPFTKKSDNLPIKPTFLFNLKPNNNIQSDSVNTNINSNYNSTTVSNVINNQSDSPQSTNSGFSFRSSPAIQMSNANCYATFPNQNKQIMPQFSNLSQIEEKSEGTMSVEKHTCGSAAPMNINSGNLNLLQGR